VKTKAVALLLLIAVSQTALGVYYSGNDLLRHLQGWEKVQIDQGASATRQELYGSGFFLGFVTATADSFDDDIFCLPAASANLQMAAVVKKYLAEHPERLDEPAVDLIINALLADFECTEN
jgi:hypothetical protein